MAFYLGSAVIVTFLIMRLAAAQTVHLVGDSIGWTVPPGGAQDYANWATGKTFAVGDILAFNFGTNEHDVLQVPKASFDACTSANAVGNVITTGPANVTLDAAGEHYYICTIGRHCAAGQKLAITVVASSTGGGNNNNANPPPAGSTTPQLPNSPPVDTCAPTPSADPTAVPGPNSPLPPTVPAPSSSPALTAHAFLAVMAIAAALLVVSV